MCEVAVLFFILSAFVVAACACARRIRATLRAVGVDQRVKSRGQRLLFQIVFTAVTAFASFLLRSCHSTIQAVSYQLQNTGINISSTNDCPISNNGAIQNVTTTNFCHPCYNVYTHVTFWMTRTPAFQLTVVLISSPVALCVALWGMTSKQQLRLMGLNHLSERFAQSRATRRTNLLENGGK